MLLGLDIGGTHTDIVIIGNDGIITSSKVRTRKNDLLSSIRKAFENVFNTIKPSDIKRINLSTTLSTNAIVENTIEKVGVFISSGPGIAPENFQTGKYYFVFDGSIDHRGTIVQQPDLQQIEPFKKKCSKKGVKVFATVTKFSIRNPEQENMLHEALESISDFTTMGHLLSGKLNFPRRIATAYYNSAVWRIYNNFADSIEKTISEYGINADINILKADGGTMPISLSRSLPVESILSGPAASIMGIIALCNIQEDSVILDIGGTTTDIAIFASGAPLIEDGISLNSLRTLVRSLRTKSIGIGGDSLIKIKKGTITVGPERRGMAMAVDGPSPTLADALNLLGHADYGSRDRSIAGIIKLSKKTKLTSREIALGAFEYALATIKQNVDEMVESINSRPVYTVHEIIEDKKVVPKRLYIVGGPAESVRSLLSEKFHIKAIIPENFAVANAIGAALARTTMEIELFADTERGVLLVPNLNIRREIPEDFNLEQAIEHARHYLKEYMQQIGHGNDKFEIDITEASSYNIVDSYFTTGKNIRVKCQIKPGIIDDYRATNAGSI